MAAVSTLESANSVEPIAFAAISDAVREFSSILTAATERSFNAAPSMTLGLAVSQSIRSGSIVPGGRSSSVPETRDVALIFFVSDADVSTIASTSVLPAGLLEARKPRNLGIRHRPERTALVPVT